MKPNGVSHHTGNADLTQLKNQDRGGAEAGVFTSWQTLNDAFDLPGKSDIQPENDVKQPLPNLNSCCQPVPGYDNKLW